MVAMALVLAACSAEPEPEPERERVPSTSRTTIASIEHDGVVLEGKLTLPEGDGPFPVVAFFFGEGPAPKSLYGLHGPIAAELLARGIGLYAWDTRGCRDAVAPPYYLLDEAVYMTATPSRVLEDARAALGWLRGHDEVDPDRVVLWGHGLGSVLAPALQVEEPLARGVLLTSWLVQSPGEVLDDIFLYRMWFRASLVADADLDGVITAAEWNAADKSDLDPEIYASFAALDADGDGSYTPADNQLVGQPALAQLHALADGGDQAGWREFWNESWIYAPSIEWALDTWARPSPQPLYTQLDVPTVAIVVAGDLEAPFPRLFSMLAAIEAGDYPLVTVLGFPGTDLGLFELATQGLAIPPLSAALDAAATLSGE
jgi:hypothetical protein